MCKKPREYRAAGRDGARVSRLHGAAEEIHGAATKLFWPLIALHVAGPLKHHVIDPDGTLQRMLWVKRVKPLALAALCARMNGIDEPT